MSLYNILLASFAVGYGGLIRSMQSVAQPCHSMTFPSQRHPRSSSLTALSLAQSLQPLLCSLSRPLHLHLDFPLPGILQYGLLCVSAEQKCDSPLFKLCYTNNILLHRNVPERTETTGSPHMNCFHSELGFPFRSMP